MKDTKHSIPWIFKALIVLYIFHTTIPIFGYLVPAVVHAAVVFILFVLLATYDSSFKKNFILITPITIIYILNMVYSGFSNFAIYFYSLLQLWLFPLLALFLMRYANTKVLKRILLLICFSYIATSITTVIGNQVYPGASRLIAAVFQSDETYVYDVYMMMNIGGFNFVYSMVLMTPIVIYMLRRRDIPRLFSLVLLICIIAVVYYTDYTTAFLSFLFTIVGLLFLRKAFGGRQVATYMVFILLVVLFFDEFVFPYLSSFGGLLGSENINARLTELSDFSVSDTSTYEGDLGSRYEIYKRSLIEFSKSPIWGSPNAKVGGHSYVFDVLGKFGLFGALCLIWMYRRLFNVFYKPFFGTNCYGYVSFVFGLAVLLAILNPKDNLSVLTFMIPVAALYFTKRSQRI